jgi:hypothetical protein
MPKLFSKQRTLKPGATDAAASPILCSRRQSAWACGLLAATVFLFVPLQIFLNNFYEFTITFPQFLLDLLILSASAAAFLFLIVLPQPARIRHWLGLAVFACGVLAWLQSTLSFGQYGVFDGRPILWTSAQNRIVFFFDLGLWLGGGALIFTQAPRVTRYLGRICAILIIMQLAGTALQSAATLSSAATPWWNRYSVDSQSEFTFSRRQNVIILVLDAFQSTLFHQLQDERPELIPCFDGFTFYPDTLGGFPVTQPSIPVILTGTYYDNSVPYVDYVKKAFAQHSLPALLKKQGFQSEVYPMVPITVYPDPESVSNLKKSRLRVDFNRDRVAISRLMDTALFRVSPQLLKKRLFNNGHWFLQGCFKSSGQSAKNAAHKNRDVQFIERMEQQASVALQVPVFKFYHLNGIHSPLTLNENLEVEHMNETRGSYRRQAMAMLKLTARFLDKLKAIGAYDNSLIIVAGDHGFGPIGIYDPDRGRVVPDAFYMNYLFVGGALPTLLIKPLGTRGEMQTSAVQATLADIPKTVFSLLGLVGPFEGLALTDAGNADVQRTRRYYTFDWKWLYKNDYLSPLKEFFVEGPVWREESWRPSPVTYEPQRMVTNHPAPIVFGVPVAFGKGKNGLPYLMMGWSEASPDRVWSTNPYASLGIPLPPTRQELQLSIRLLPFLAPSKLEAQHIAIHVNGRHLQDVRLTSKAFEWQHVAVPRSAVDGDFLKIEFTMPDAASPVSLGMGAEDRLLGVALRELTITERSQE